MDLINKIELNYLHEREHIKRLLPEIQKHSCYEFIKREARDKRLEITIKVCKI